MINHCLHPSTVSHCNSGIFPSPPCMYSVGRVLPEGPQSVEDMGIVGSGNSVKGADFIKALESWPLEDLRR